MASSREEDQLDLQLKLFASYSPAEVVLRYAHETDPRPPDKPEHNEFEGAIGFVDVSGFTALSEKLNKDHGRKGAELLNQCVPRPAHVPASCHHAATFHKMAPKALDPAWIYDHEPRGGVGRRGKCFASQCVEHTAHLPVCACRYINAYFKELIDGIFLHSGDVIKFAGDAMQVVWRNRRDTCESLPQLVLRASVCCLDLLKRLNNFSPVDGVTLRLHMGVGCGHISEFYVGGHGNKWEYFVAGEPIEQMSDATEEATHGQLVLSTAAYKVLADAEEVRCMHFAARHDTQIDICPSALPTSRAGIAPNRIYIPRPDTGCGEKHP